MLYLDQKSTSAVLDQPVPDLHQLRAAKSGAIGTTWRPIPHRDIDGAFTDALQRQGFTIREARYAVSKDGYDAWGCYRLDEASTDLFGEAQALSPCIGWRSSNVQRFSFSAVVGLNVCVCSNGLFEGDFRALDKKHTSGVSVHALTRDAAGAVRRRFANLEHRCAMLESRALRDEEASHILVTMARSGSLAAHRISGILREYEEPRHEEFRPRTAWSLVNAVTERAKAFSRGAGERALTSALETAERVCFS